MSGKFAVIPRLQGAANNVWQEYGQLAAEYNPINLGLGFPDFLPPKFITDALAAVQRSTDDSLHQYTRPNGLPRLVNVLAKLYSTLLNRKVDAEFEIIATLGASEALFCAVTALIDDGDEVIIIEPYFEAYVPLIKIAGGTPKFVALKPKSNGDAHDYEGVSSADWELDPRELEDLFNEKTKAIILNTPNNPLGKVFDLSELTLIASLCKKWNVCCIADEVYEWMVYKPKEHIRIASLPEMWERTVTIGSAGKTFCVTGWKVGWVYGAAKLLRGLKIVHQYAVFTGSTPLQEVIAIAFEEELSRLGQDNSYFVTLQHNLKSKRDYIAKKLSDANMKPTLPDAGIFIVADWSKLEPQIDLSSETDAYKDFRFTKWLTKTIGLQGIPPTVFFTDENKYLIEHYVRFCFIKKEEVLEKAAEKLNELLN